MSQDVRDTDERSKLDEALLVHLPQEGEVVEVTSLGLSEWSKTYRITVRLADGASKQFFQKEAIGGTAEDLIRSNWASEPVMYGFIPKYVPRPIAAGRYKSMDDSWFFLMEWVDMVDGPDKVDGENKPAGSLPSPEVLVPPVAALHRNSWGKCLETSPEKKFGASVNFWFGSLCLQNGWTSTWETWWINRMTQAFDKEAEARGPLATEDGEAVRLFLTKVLRRYLRPMESNGRSITPCLVHTDLWPGNFKLRKGEGSCVIFDSNPVWGHNELELATFRNPRYKMGKPYIDEYRKYIAPTAPAEDTADRLVMYMIGHQVYLATVYPKDDTLRNIWKESVRSMVDKVLKEEAVGKTLVSLTTPEPVTYLQIAECD